MKRLQRRPLWSLWILVMGSLLLQVSWADDTLVTETQTYYTDYFTNFGYTTGGNFHRQADGTLHLALIENYELYYLRSTNEGATWSKQQVMTGHEGGLYMASLTVDRNGKVFIGFTVNDNFNYGNPTGVGYGTEFYYDVYCANNVSGSWVTETVYKPTRTGWAVNFGAKVGGMIIDADNNVRLYANRYGWYSYGGTAWEWTRSAANGSWGGQVTVASFTDTSVDRFIYGYFRPVIHADGAITLVMMRGKSLNAANEELFYVTDSGSGWSAPTVIDSGFSRAYAGAMGFDAALDPAGNLHLVYTKNSAVGEAEVHYSHNFAPSEKIYTGYLGADATEQVWDLKLHSNASGDLTALLRHGNKLPDNSSELLNTLLFKHPSGGAWSAPMDLPLPVAAPDGDVWNHNVVLTDTAAAHFGDFEVVYMDVRAPVTAGGPYGPHEVYHYLEQTTPIPDIKANGSDGPVVMTDINEPLSITVSLQAKSYAGAPADWWLVADSDMGRYWYTVSNGWVSSNAPVRAYSGVLLDLAMTNVLNLVGLPAGVYDFYFSVDDNNDGLFDRSFEDHVNVTIETAGP